MTPIASNLPPEGESAGSGAPSGTCSGGGVGMPPPETLSGANCGGSGDVNTPMQSVPADAWSTGSETGFRFSRAGNRGGQA